MVGTGPGEYSFKLKIDNQQLNLDIEQAKKAFADLAKQAKKAGAVFDDIPNPFEQFTGGAPKVEAAKKQFDALGMSVAQLARETPALAMGVNTYFLAISNNLPIFADAVKKVREENAALAAQGKPTVSVLKQIGSALISWQTLLIAAVTMLAMNSDKVWAWVKGLFSAKDALDDVTRAEKALLDVRRQGTIAAQEEVTKIRLTVQAAQDATASIEERTNAIRTLKKEYPDYFANLSSEQIMYGDIADSVQALVDKTIALAQARKAFNQLVENEENLQLLQGMGSYAEFESANAAFEGVGRQRKFKQQVGGRASDYVWKYNDLEADAYEEAQDKLLEELEDGGERASKLLELIEDKYDGDVDAFIKATQAANERLTTEAQGVVATGSNAAVEAAQRAAEQLAEASARLKADAQRATSQAEVDAMAEGIRKEIAQINLNYNLKEQAIAKREEELRKLRGGMLTKQEEDAIAAMRKANASERDRSTQAAYNALFAEADAWLKENNSEVEAWGEELNKELARRTKAWEDYFLKYGTIKERLLAVTKKYNRLINDAETEAERMSLEAERDAILAQYEVETSAWAEELVGKTREQLNTMIDALTAEVEAKEAAFNALDSSTGEDAANYRKQIATLNAQIAALKKRLGEANDAVSNNNWAEATQVFQNIGSAATDAADGIAEFDEGLADALRGIAQLASSATNMIGAIQGVMTAFKEGLSGIEKASAILAVVGAAIQLVSGIAEAFNGGEEAAKAATLAALEYARALEKISNIELRESFSNYFGTDDFGRFSALLGKTREQLQEIDAITKELDQNWIGATGVDYNASLDAYSANRRAQAALIKKANEADIQLVADMRSGWQKFWGTGYQNVDVKDLKDFFDEDGILNVDMLKAYYDNYAEYLDAEQKELIESLINTGEEYAANLAEINSYMQNIFGELGASITDSLVDAFKNGTDAAEAMGDAVGNVLERIATDMAHAAFIQPLLDEAQKAIDALNKQRSEGGMSDEEYMRELMGISSTLMGNAQDVGEGMAAYLDAMRQMAKEMGIDAFESDSAKNSTYAKGFQAMSQETGSELNGRFTDIQGQTHRIAEAVEVMQGIQASHLQHMQSVSSTLASIHNDTTLIARHTKALARMDANLDAMRRAIDNGAI